MASRPTTEQIRARAHALWVADGRPQGAEQLYWTRAQRELLREAEWQQAPPPPAPDPAPSTCRLRGHIDTMSTTRIAGWVQDEGDPFAHLEVVITDAGVEIARLVASLFRPDLKAAGIGDGCYAYEFIFPAGFWEAGPHRLAVTFPADPGWVSSNPMTADS